MPDFDNDDLCQPKLQQQVSPVSRTTSDVAALPSESSQVHVGGEGERSGKSACAGVKQMLATRAFVVHVCSRFHASTPCLRTVIRSPPCAIASRVA